MKSTATLRSKGKKAGLITLVVMLLSVVPAASVLGSRLQQDAQQNASSEPQAQPPSPQRQIISKSSLRTLTGCVVRSNHGYSLKTENETYPIDTDKNLSAFVDMRITITGIVEHHTAASLSAIGSNATTVTDLHVLELGSMNASCNQSN